MNAKETLKEIRTMLGFSDEETKVEMATATLTDGTVISYDGELAIGTAIFVQTAEGDIPAPDATHEVEGGLLVTTEGGFVTEIVITRAGTLGLRSRLARSGPGGPAQPLQVSRLHRHASCLTCATSPRPTPAPPAPSP